MSNKKPTLSNEMSPNVPSDGGDIEKQSIPADRIQEGIGSSAVNSPDYHIPFDGMNPNYSSEEHRSPDALEGQDPNVKND